MAPSSIIRRLAAGLLLVVFALGITPKRTIHNFVATHKDATAKAARQTQGEELGRAGFNCQVDNLVCESPFTPDTEPFHIAAAEFYPVFESSFISAPYYSEHFSFGLRGPPVA